MSVFELREIRKIVVELIMPVRWQLNSLRDILPLLLLKTELNKDRMIIINIYVFHEFEQFFRTPIWKCENRCILWFSIVFN